MANSNEKQAGDGQASAVPPNWPGIPGRSEAKEKDTPEGEGPPSDVTEAQRKLERDVKKSTP